ncbi:HDOD domain-containing protein [Ferrigenium sp. UT5]|uniref:HDOD domain-containing protein n=1 Tax=Ferrigenium sp. UT5 TaxID=3242105 RepID=UPI00354B7BC8
MSDTQQQAIADEVLSAIESGKLELPTLPDVALKIRELIDDPNVSADQLVNLLSADPVISAHIIKAANSAAGGMRVDTLRAAIARLGYRMLRNLVISVTVNNLFKASSPVIDQYLKRMWEHSRMVAATSFVLALKQRHLKPEQAMLAGMVHNLGALPLCLYADRFHPRLEQDALEELIRRFSTRVGVALLNNWHFPQEIINVVAGYENLQRSNASGTADYTDVVTIANLQIPGKAKFVAWQNVSAITRIGCEPGQCTRFIEDHAEQLDIAREMLGLPKSQPQATEHREQQMPPQQPQDTQQTVSRQKPGMLGGFFNLFR